MTGSSREGRDEFMAKVRDQAVVPPYVMNDFAVVTEAKLAHGDAKYGEDAWRQHDMLAEALDEVIDLGNYFFLKWRQLREVECNPAVMTAMEALAEAYAAVLPYYANIRSLQQLLDQGGVPRSLTTEDFVGVQPREPGEPKRLDA